MTIQEPDTLGTIALLPALAHAVLSNGTAARYRIFVALRYLDSTGEGRLPKASATVALGEIFGQTVGAVRKQIQRGLGVWWHASNGYIFLHGQDRVARALGLAHGGQTAVLEPVQCLKGSIRHFRAALLDSQMPRRPKVQARSTIQRKTGVSPSTQRRYESQDIAIHNDGEGNAPIRSEPRYDDFTGVLMQSTDQPNPTPSGWSTELRQELDRRGFFGRTRLQRQRPHKYVQGGLQRSRTIAPKFRESSSLKVDRGSSEDYATVKIGQLRLRSPRLGYVAIGRANGDRDILPTAMFLGASSLPRNFMYELAERERGWHQAG